MPQKINYQLILDKTLAQVERLQKKPKLILHACCAPCSSYVLLYLTKYFDITLYFYNPNISPQTEYDFRLNELQRFCTEITQDNVIEFLYAEYDPTRFFETVKGLEDLPEGSERCFKCYALRLEQTAKIAAENGFDFFTTTLSISPMKNSAVLNNIGSLLEKQFGVPYLYSDYKKKDGYKQSIVLSQKHNLYRQDYCGCIYSRNQRQAKND